MLKQNYNLPEQPIFPNLKERGSIPKINFKGNKKKDNFFLTGNVGFKQYINYDRDRLLIPHLDNYNKRIYFKQPLFDNKKVITLNSKIPVNRSRLPKIRVNDCLLNPDVILERRDIYRTWSLKDVLLFEKAVLPRFKY